MNDFVTGILSQVSLSNMWDTISPAAPLVAVGVFVAFGYGVLLWALSHLSFYGGSVSGTISNYRHRNDWD
jgi:hypothetical protein